MPIASLPGRLFLLTPLLLLPVGSLSSEILLQDGFDGELSENWIVFGDPVPFIDSTAGHPAPSFCNNGDTMYESGAVSRMVFTVSEGLTVEGDLFVNCHERGAWVAACIGLVHTEYTDGMNPDLEAITYLHFKYMGELNWQQPHLGTTITTGSLNSDGARFRMDYIHADSLSDSWHLFSMQLDGEGYVRWYLDGDLLLRSPEPLPSEIDSVRVYLGERSSDWGVALHDNVVIRRP